MPRAIKHTFSIFWYIYSMKLCLEQLMLCLISQGQLKIWLSHKEYLSIKNVRFLDWIREVFPPRLKFMQILSQYIFVKVSKNYLYRLTSYKLNQSASINCLRFDRPFRAVFILVIELNLIFFWILFYLVLLTNCFIFYDS